MITALAIPGQPHSDRALRANRRKRKSEPIARIPVKLTVFQSKNCFFLTLLLEIVELSIPRLVHKYVEQRNGTYKFRLFIKEYTNPGQKGLKNQAFRRYQ